MAANCVTSQQKKSPEYIGAMEKLDISSSVLELLLFEYQSLPENEEAFSKGELPFPSIEYLQGQLYAPAITVLDGTIIEYYDKHFGKPFTAKTLQEANNIAHVIGRRIGRESVRIVETKDGQYKVLTTRPQLDNVGTFSELSDNIYYNLTQQESPKEALLRTLDKDGLIHKLPNTNDYVLTLNIGRESKEPRQDSINKAYEKVQDRLERLGFPKNIVSIEITKAGGSARVFIDELKLSEVKDAVQLGAKIQDIKAIYDLADFLSEKFGVKFGGIIPQKQANQMTNNANPNAFIQNNTVYVVANKVTIDTIAEEFLHPFVNTLYKQSPDVFEDLYKEALALFPNLKASIISNYTGRKNHKFTSEDLKQELVAQALSRHFREEYENSLKTEGLTVLQILKKMDESEKFFTKAWDAIRKLFKELQEKLIGDKYVFESNDLKNLSLRQVAQLINAKDFSFWTIHDNNTRFNLNNVKSYSGNITPSENTIFVFGSNPEGRHGAGAAKVAKEQFGAQYGVGEGLTGNAYALPTKDLRVKENNSLRSIPKETIVESIKKLYQTALENPTKEFKVAFRNGLNETTLNGYTGEEMIDMFIEAGSIPSNVLFSEEWISSGKFDNSSIAENLQQQLQENTVIQTNQLADAIDTLLGIDSILNRSEVQELAYKICIKISDILTAIQEDPSIVENITNGRIKGTPEMSKMRRNKLMLTVGATDIVNYVKELVFGQYNENITDDMFELADLLYEQFNTLLNIGMSLFAATEGFSFNFTGNNSIVSDSVESLEDLDEAELSENEGSRLEAWLVEAVTKSVIDRMSQSVKAVLQSCKILDSEGKPILDRWGLSDNVSLQNATQTIIKVTSGSFTLSDMIEKLEKATTNFPWIQQLLPMLKDKSGKYSQFQSQFYGAIQSHFLLYSVVRTEYGKIATKTINKDTALSEAKKSVVSLYNIRQHPLFDSNGNVNKTSLQLLEGLQEELKNEQIEDKTPVVNSILQLLGYNTDISSIQSVLNESIVKTISDTLHYIIKDLNSHKEDKLSTWKPFSSNPKDKGIINNIGKILKPFTDVTIDPTLSSFHSDGKMYQSNKIPSYLTKLFLKFKELSNTENSSTELTDYNQFLKDEYGFSEWFRDTSEDLGVEVNLEIQKGWRLSWLRMLASDPKAREIFAHKVDISYDKKGYMKSSTGKYMNELEYGLMSIAEYFSETTEKNAQEDMIPAWFRVPMQSNKPSADYIRFYSYRGQNYKQAIVNDLLGIFNLELSRMQTCVMRKQEIAKDKSIEISSFDKNGTKFCFLDFLETKRKNSEFGELVLKKINGQEIDEAKLLSLAELLITESIDLRVLEIYSEFEAKGLVKQLSKVKGINTSNIKESVENFLWNDFLASINILQLTITDVAYYKNAEDLQKRLAQIHAPGTRPNIEAKDLEGNEITDGTYRTLILEDFEGIKSNIIENLKFVFELRLSELDDNNPNKVAAKAVYDNIISMFETLINVTDAQGYSCPTSYRKKALMFGKWSQRHEDIYLKLLKGEFSLTDIEEAFGPLKPFVYSNTTRDTYIEGAPIQKLKTGVQYKNSEYLLVMADALLKGVRNGRPNLLKAIFEVMEDSYKKVEKTKGIDTIQFISSMKTGISGVISLNDLVEDPDGYKKAKARLEGVLYKEDGSYNTKHVHESSFEDYCIQQEVPPHFKNHHQAHGSLTRAIIPSDLDVNTVYKVGDLEYTAQEFIEEYEKLITENIKDSYKSLSKELEWSSETNRTEEGRANLRRHLSEILQRELLSSQRHSLDLLFACSLKDGDFRVPLGDAVQSNKIELLINSIIKNRINKQEIAGGPVVQASSFGMSKLLNIVFKDSKGNPLMTLKQYKELGGTVEGFKLYIKDNQAGISHFEVFAPIYDERLLEFLDADGTIDIKAIEKLNPELLDLVAYRIPTEDKYSIIPCKIVGFVPREAGEVIMMPEEVTLITGSDREISLFLPV